MSVFIVQRHPLKPTFKVEQLSRSSRSREVATFDLTISVNGETAAQIMGAKLVDGKEGRFVAGPSFPGGDGRWVAVVTLGRELQSDLIKQLENQLKEKLTYGK